MSECGSAMLVEETNPKSSESTGLVMDNERKERNAEEERETTSSRKSSESVKPKEAIDERGTAMSTKLLLATTAVMVAYLLIGGAVFHALEYTQEHELEKITAQKTNQFLKNYSCVSPEEFHKLVNSIIKAYNQGIVIRNGTIISTGNWDFYSSVFFATTVVTTIGYGNIAPSSSGSRAFCVIYAVIGIPLALTYLGGIGYTLSSLSEKLGSKLAKRTRFIKNQKLGQLFRTVVIFLLGNFIFLIGPSIIFYYVQGWTFEECVYYCYITLFTIGFGDFVAGSDFQAKMSDNERGFYRLFVSLWIYVGLAWLAMIVSDLTNLCLMFFKATQKKLVEPRGDEEIAKEEPHNGIELEKIEDPQKSAEHPKV